MRALRLDIVAELWHCCRKWWATECFSVDPTHNDEQMARTSHIRFCRPSFVLPASSDFFVFLSNFSERGELLRADVLFCFSLLNI